MIVVWLRSAEQDRLNIGQSIAIDNPAAARRMDELFALTVQSLEEFPAQGRPGVVLGTRELFPHPNYRLVYEVDGNHVYILTLVHSARQWPLTFDN